MWSTILLLWVKKRPVVRSAHAWKARLLTWGAPELPAAR